MELRDDFWSLIAAACLVYIEDTAHFPIISKPMNNNNNNNDNGYSNNTDNNNNNDDDDDDDDKPF